MRQPQYTMMTNLTKRECYLCTGVRCRPCKHSDRTTQLPKQLNQLTSNHQKLMFSICLLVLSLKYLNVELFSLAFKRILKSRKKNGVSMIELEIKLLLADLG